MKWNGFGLPGRLLFFGAIALFLAGCSPSSNDAQTEPAVKINQSVKNNRSANAAAKVVLSEMTISGLDKEIQLNIRHKSLENKSDYKANEVVLFLEPYSVPAAEAFDVPGYSWMEQLANKGYDTWALDFRGFGKSSRPVEMDQPPADHKPVVRLDDCVNDLSAAVEYIKKYRNVNEIHIVGWSYGSVVAAKYAADHPETVGKLVLYGYMHGFDLPLMAKLYEAKDRPGQFNPNMPAYQIIDFDKAMHHWQMMLNGKELVTEDAMAAVRKVFNDSDPTGVNREKNAIRRPIGPLADLYQIWSNKPLFDMARIQAPVLVIRGELDFFAEAGVLHKLTGTNSKKEVVIKDATHWAIYEKNHEILFNETEQFLK